MFCAEMSEWFKEHDWKSCDGGDSSGGSNPLLCATQSHPLGVVFLWCREEAGRNDAGSREAQSAEALPRGSLWVSAKSSNMIEIMLSLQHKATLWGWFFSFCRNVQPSFQNNFYFESTNHLIISEIFEKKLKNILPRSCRNKKYVL